MPESVSTVDAILDGLREKAVFVSVTASRPMEVQFSPVDGPGGGFVEFADAVAAVHAAADARTQEIVETLHDIARCPDKDAVAALATLTADLSRAERIKAAQIVGYHTHALVTRRFPNGGTPDGP